MTMVRKQIYIGEEEDEDLKRRARDHGMTEAAVIRYLSRATRGGVAASATKTQTSSWT